MGSVFWCMLSSAIVLHWESCWVYDIDLGSTTWKRPPVILISEFGGVCYVIIEWICLAGLYVTVVSIMVSIPLIKSANWRSSDFFVETKSVVFIPSDGELRRSNLCIFSDVLAGRCSMLNEMELNSLLWGIILPNTMLGTIWVCLIEHPFTMDGFSVVLFQFFHILSSSGNLQRCPYFLVVRWWSCWLQASFAEL